MIGGRAPRTKFGSGGRTAGDFGNSLKYIGRDKEHLREGQEPALAVWVNGVSPDLELAAVQMEALARGSKRAKEPLYFLTASWTKGEIPTQEQAKEALDVYIKHLGFEGLQYVASLQNDGKAGLYHIHAVFNLVDPATKTVRDLHQEAMKCRAASREVEFTQGWERADNRTKREKAKEARERGLTIAQLRDLERPQQLLAALTTHEVAFTRKDAHEMIMDRVKDKEKHAETLEAVMAQAIPLWHRGTLEEHFTTQAVIDAHQQLEEAYRGMAASKIAAVATNTPEGLTPEQRIAFEYATTAGGKLRVITGVPGFGKTFLIDPIAEAYRAKGYRVRAVSVANSAVDVLRQDTDVPARSVCSEIFTWGIDDKQRLGPRDVLIIDEVSTLGVEWARDLIVEAHKRGAVVLEIGDDKQFQAVAYGDALGMARTIEPGVDMKTTLRQKTEWQARATEDLRAGRIREGLDAYQRGGLLHGHATQADARAAIVADWKDIERGGFDREAVECGIETMTNAERCELSPLLRDAHDELGRLSGPEVKLETMDGLTPYRAGDRVVARDTIREAGLKNGSVVTVTAVKGKVLTVQRRDGKNVQIDTRSEHGSQIQHAYCHTEYREQGKNRYAELQMVDSLVHQRSLVVGMTRHSHLYGMHYSAEKVGSYENLVAFGERERCKTSLKDYTVRDLAAEQREVQERALAEQQHKTAAEMKKKVAQSVKRTPSNAQYREPDIIDSIRQELREKGVRDRDLPSHADLEAQLRDLQAKIEKQRPSSSYAYEPLSEAQQLAREWQAMQRSQMRGRSMGR